MSNIKIDCINETCPVPLVETRKAINNASAGDIIQIVGDHSSSKKEIPMAVEAMQHELLSIEENGAEWKIKIKLAED